MPKENPLTGLEITCKVMASLDQLHSDLEPQIRSKSRDSELCIR